jgi:hypothetical protein
MLLLIIILFTACPTFPAHDQEAPVYSGLTEQHVSEMLTDCDRALTRRLSGARDIHRIPKRMNRYPNSPAYRHSVHTIYHFTCITIMGHPLTNTD